MPNPTSSPSAQSILAKIVAVPVENAPDNRYRSAILDSTLAAWHSRQTGAAVHEQRSEHKPPPAERIPIPKIGFVEQRPFIHLYAEIQAAKRADSAAATRELEWRLDELVYALYGLTEAESTAIERSLGLIHATDAAEDAALGRAMAEALAEPGERVGIDEIRRILRGQDGT